MSDLESVKIESLCDLTRESFGVDDISNDEILKRLDTSVLVVPSVCSEVIGFFSTDILSSDEVLGIYNSGGVIKKDYQRGGLYKKIRSAFATDDLDFVSTRTQNVAVYKSFVNLFPDSVPCRNPNILERDLGVKIANYLDCGDSFDSGTFVCSGAYEGSRNNTNLIEGLESTDAYILLNKK